MSELEGERPRAGFILRPQLHIVDARGRESVPSARTIRSPVWPGPGATERACASPTRVIVFVALLVAFDVRLAGMPLPQGQGAFHSG